MICNYVNIGCVYVNRGIDSQHIVCFGRYHSLSGALYDCHFRNSGKSKSITMVRIAVATMANGTQNQIWPHQTLVVLLVGQPGQRQPMCLEMPVEFMVWMLTKSGCVEEYWK